MNTIEDAWRWYYSTQQELKLLKRLAGVYWHLLPWEKGLDKDERFQLVGGAQLAEETHSNLTYLDDLAVVVLFSVFESQVRAFVLREMQQEADGLRHPALKLAAAEVAEAIEEGSFYHVLLPFKTLDHNLVEQVNQVRRYRNWVAHGKRGNLPDSVTPQVAFDRLRQFLDKLLPTRKSESQTDAPPDCNNPL
jgi:hypothetical protein